MAALEASSVLRQAGIEVASVRVVITRVSNGDSLFKRTVAVAPGQASLTLEADVLLRSAEEELSAFMEFLDAGGTVLYRGEQRVVARAGNNAPVTVDAAIEFVGPGATAATVRLTPGDTTISTATPLALTAVAVDGAGAPITGAILLWASSDITLASVSTTGLVTPAGPRGAVQVSARTPLGITGTSTIRLMPPPVRIVLVGGDGQTGAAGTALPQPFTVEVQAADGLPVAGETVSFSAVTAGGTVATATAATDAQGRASTAIKLGTAAGRYEFRAVSGSLGAVTVKADATPAAAATITMLSGDGQSATVGTALASPLVVKVKDAFGNLVAGQTVKWQLVSGTGTLSAATSVSDASGHASVSYVAGAVPATESVKATLDGTTSTVTFKATATLGAPSQILIASGDAQTGDEGSMLASPLVVLVKDALGNPVPGAQVTWAVTTGNATLSQATTVTDANAKASNTVTLGNPAVMPASVSITATLASGASVTFGATIVALPPVPAQLQVATQPATAAAGATMTPPLSARIADAAGVAVAQAGVAVTASVYAPSASVGTLEKGGMSPMTNTMRELVGTTTVTSDATGTATFSDLAITGSVGAVQVAFSASGLAGAVSSTINLVAGTPQVISIVSGDAQSGVEGTPLAVPLVVTVTDASGNATPGAVVGWAVTSDNAAVAHATSVTDTASRATNIVTLGAPVTLPATAVITATIASGASVTFTATITAAPLVPAKLMIAQQPSAGAIGVTLSPEFRVQVSDTSGNGVPQAGIAVTAALYIPSLAALPPDSGAARASRTAVATDRSLSGTLTVTTDSAGVATYPDLKVTGPTGSVEIQFTSPNLAPVVATPLALAAGSVASLAIEPAAPAGLLSTITGSPLQDSIWVATRDASGNPVGSVPLSMSIRSGTPDGAEVGSATNQTDAGGTFHASRFPIPSQVGTYYIRFSIPESTIPQVIIGVEVLPPPSPSLTFLPLTFVPVEDSVLTNEELSVLLKNPDGTPVSGASITWRKPGTAAMSAVLSPSPVRRSGSEDADFQPSFSTSSQQSSYASGFLVGGGVQDSAITTTDVNGAAKVTFTRGTVAGTIAVTAEATGHSLSATQSVHVAPGKPIVIRIEQGPSLTARAGVVLAQQPVVSLRDMWGNAVSQAGVPITAGAVRHYRTSAVLLAGASPSSTSASTTCPECENPQYLIGTTTVQTDATGRATFTDLALGAPVDSYSIVYSNEALELSGEYPNGCGAKCGEPLIELTAGPPAKWLLSASNDAPNVGTTVQVYAFLQDAWQNPVVDGVTRNVTWSAAPAGVFDPSAAADVDGQDSTSFTVSTTPGTDHRVTVSHTEAADGRIVSGAMTITAVQAVVAAAVQIVEGDNQVKAPGDPLAPMRVRVMDFQGMPVASATVRWSARRSASYSSYDDYTYPTTSLSDSAGYAVSPSLTLPQLEGRTGYVIQAQVLGGTQGSPYVGFRAVSLLPGYTHVWMGPKVGSYDGVPTWHTAGLWHTGAVPTSSSNVLIPDLDAGEWSIPTLGAPAAVADLHAFNNDWGTFLDIGAQTLTVGGVLHASSINGTGTVALTGARKAARVDLWSGTLQVAAGADIVVNEYLDTYRLVVNGRLDLADSYVYAADTLRIEGAGAALAANHYNASAYGRHVVFDGAASAGTLAEGYLEFRHSFQQRSTWSAASFAPGERFEVYSHTADTGSVSFQTPGAAGSYFSYMQHYYGVLKQLTPVYVANDLQISAQWHANGLTAEALSVETGDTLFIAGTSNLIRRLTLELNSTLNTAYYQGSVEVQQCQNNGAILEGLSLQCNGLGSLLPSLTLAGDGEPAEEGQPRRTRREPPVTGRAKLGGRASSIQP